VESLRVIGYAILAQTGKNPGIAAGVNEITKK
jgi:hypothetical protein